MRTHRQAIAIAVLVTATALAGCSSDGDGKAASADTLTETEFVTQANALCAAQSKSIGEVVGPLFAAGKPDPADQQAALDKVVDLSRGLADDIDALAEPEDLTAKVDDLVASLGDGTDAAAKQTGAEFFASEDDPWADAVAKAKALGLDACASEE